MDIALMVVTLVGLMFVTAAVFVPLVPTDPGRPIPMNDLMILLQLAARGCVVALGLVLAVADLAAYQQLEDDTLACCPASSASTPRW